MFLVLKNQSVTVCQCHTIRPVSLLKRLFEGISPRRPRPAEEWNASVKRFIFFEVWFFMLLFRIRERQSTRSHRTKPSTVQPLWCRTRKPAGSQPLVELAWSVDCMRRTRYFEPFRREVLNVDVECIPSQMLRIVRIKRFILTSFQWITYLSVVCLSTCTFW